MNKYHQIEARRAVLLQLWKNSQNVEVEDDYFGVLFGGDFAVVRGAK